MIAGSGGGARGGCDVTGGPALEETQVAGGRPTASRWGVWSSDRRVGCRRVPVLLLGLARSGPVAVAALAAYTLGRQFVLGLRADPPRRSPRSGRVTAAAAAAVLAASIAVLALGPA